MFKNLLGFKATEAVINLDRTDYVPGNVVSGTVTINVENLKGQDLDSLEIYIKGTESVSFKNVVGSNGGKSSTKKIIYGKNVFFKIKTIVPELSGNIAQGSHVFPFSFILPLNIPGSFNLENTNVRGDSSTASINFCVGCRLRIPGLFNFDICESVYTFVHSTPILPIGPVSFNSEKPATFLWCISRGKVSVIAHVDRNCCEPGNRFNMNLLVNSAELRAEIKMIQTSIVTRCQLLAESKSIYLISKNCKTKVIDIPTLSRGEFSFIFEAPRYQAPSISGKNLIIKHFIKIKLAIKNASYLRFEIPVEISPLGPTKVFVISPTMITYQTNCGTPDEKTKYPPAITETVSSNPAFDFKNDKFQKNDLSSD